MKSQFTNTQAIAEDKLLEVLRSAGAFTPPEQLLSRTEQSLRLDRAIVGLCDYAFSTKAHPKYIREALLEGLAKYNI